MPPRISLFASSRAIAYRPKATVGLWQRGHIAAPLIRGFADSKDLPQTEQQKGPNTDTLPHVSEETASMSKIRGGEGPDIEQGTPIEEVVKGDKKAQEMLPKVMQQNNTKTKKPEGTRSYHTSAVRRQDLTMFGGPASDLDPSMIGLNTSSLTAQAKPTQVSTPGVKFGLPALPLPPRSNLNYRYDPLVDQVTNLLMRHGQLGVAQRNMSVILNTLRTSPPPTVNPQRPLIPGAPPPSHLPLNPVLYLTLAIDSVAPLLRIRSQRGAAGGGVALQIPVPLGLRQRRRTAIQWILDAASKKKNRSSGRDTFAQRVAEELIAVVEGRSGVWDRRGGVHKLGVSARANLNYKPGGRRR